MASFSKLMGLVGCLVCFTNAATAEELGVLTTEREFKGYQKRHRLSLGNSYSLSPSQLHEVYGSRFDGSVEGSSTANRLMNRRADIQSQTVTARGLIGGDIVSAGIGGQVRSFQASMSQGTDEESEQLFKLTPQLAATVADYLTFGIESDVAYVSSIEEVGGRNVESSGKFWRPTAGISFHTPKLEFGISATAPAVTKLRRNESINPDAQTFGLVGKDLDLVNREIYMAAHQTVFGRGNLDNNWSVIGSLSHVQLDTNQAKVLPVLERYRKEDRLAANLQLTYWTSDRSRFSGALNYRGATFAPAGYEENGLNFRLANLYGGNVEAVWRASKSIYVGGTVGLMRGERSQTYQDVAYSAREQSLRMLGNLSVDM